MMAKRKAASIVDKYPQPEYADVVRLRMCREDLGLSQVDLSRLTGVTQAMISWIECGQKPFIKRYRNQIWPVIEYGYEVMIKTLNKRSERLQQEAEAKKRGGGFLALRINDGTTFESFKQLPMTITERLQNEISVLTGQLEESRRQVTEERHKNKTLTEAIARYMSGAYDPKPS